MTGGKRISRRAALARLGFGAVGAYMAPSVTRLSAAQAASSASPPSPASDPSPASAPTRASPPSDPSPPSAASQSSAPTRPSGPSRSSGASGAEVSGPSGPGACRPSSIPGGAQITRRDYERAQRAISRGDARPLREILNTVQSSHPGRLVQVGFSETGGTPSFRVLIVDRAGAVVSITVDAGSGRITSVRKC